MARKTLLTEGEVRQFMKLANLPAVGQKRISEMGLNLGINEEFPGEEEEELEAPLGGLEDDEMGPPTEDEVTLDDEPEAVELGDAEMDVEGSEGSEAEEIVARIAHDLEMLAGLANVEVDVQDDADSDVDASDDMEMDVEPAMDDMEMGMEDPGPDLAPEEEEEEELPPGSRGVYENQEEIVNEVARRVAARLGKTQKKEAIADQLAERILKRLTKTK